MPAKPPEPTSGAVDAGLYNRLGAEIELLQAKLTELEAKRQALLESEQRQRTERASERESDIPGIPE